MSKHTISIFEKIYNNLPPLVPEEIKQEMSHALEHFQNDFSVTLEEIDDTMIIFGKKIWPYWKAFNEFLDMYEGKFGEKFLLGRIPRELKFRYKEFKEHGGIYKDVYSGSPATFFSIEERQMLSSSLVEVDSDIRQQVMQAVLSVERKKYEELILNFQIILDDIEKRLDSLRLMADDEQEHPQLAGEIREQVKAFEYGLCLLGPHVQHEDVKNAELYFQERKIYKNLHR